MNGGGARGGKRRGWEEEARGRLSEEGVHLECSTILHLKKRS